MPYAPPIIDVAKSIRQTFFSAGSLSAREKNIGFEEHRTQLEQRMSVVEQGLTRCGIRTVPLGTEEVIEHLYKEFNPGDLEKPIAAGMQNNT
mgnify:FL=1